MTAQARTNVLCDVNGTAIVRISKTGTGRFVGYSPTAARALDRCLRGPGPGGHRLAAGGKLFLGPRGQDLKYAGRGRGSRGAGRRGVPQIRRLLAQPPFTYTP